MPNPKIKCKSGVTPVSSKNRSCYGKFDRKIETTQDAQHLAYNELSMSNQINADLIESQASRLEQGEKIVGQELTSLRQALSQVNQAATDMQADALRRVGQALQVHHDQHHVQAAVSTQLQSNDEELRDTVLDEQNKGAE